MTHLQLLFKVSILLYDSVYICIYPIFSRYIAAPVIRVRPVDVVVLSPDTAMFYCEAFGVLTPNITWMRNGDTLVSGSDDITIITNVVTSVRNSTLQIVNTVPDDAASYTCLATNAAGNDTASVTLVVNGKCW